MDKELREYLELKFRVSDITTAGYTFISIGFGFMFVGVSLAMVDPMLAHSFIIIGLVEVSLGCFLRRRAEPPAKRSVKKEDCSQH